MRSLQTVAMGLVIVFLDVGSNGWDWVADPVGWILVVMGLAPLKERLRGYAALAATAWACLAVSVLTLPADSVDSITPTLGWLFSLPTIAFAALLCSSLAAVSDGSRRTWLRSLTGVFVVVGLLPALVYLGGLDWLTIPTAVAAVLANVALVLSTWGAGAEDDEEPSGWRRDKVDRTPTVTSTGSTGRKPTGVEPEPGGRRKQPQGFDAEAVKRRVRREREQWAEQGD